MDKHLKELLPDYLRGNLSAAEREQVEQALAASSELRAEAQELTRYFEAVDAMEPAKASDDFLEKVNVKIERRHSPLGLLGSLFGGQRRFPMEAVGLLATVALILAVVKSVDHLDFSQKTVSRPASDQMTQPPVAQEVTAENKATSPHNNALGPKRDHRPNTLQKQDLTPKSKEPTHDAPALTRQAGKVPSLGFAPAPVPGAAAAENRDRRQSQPQAGAGRQPQMAAAKKAAAPMPSSQPVAPSRPAPPPPSPEVKRQSTPDEVATDKGAQSIDPQGLTAVAPEPAQRLHHRRAPSAAGLDREKEAQVKSSRARKRLEVQPRALMEEQKAFAEADFAPVPAPERPTSAETPSFDSLETILRKSGAHFTMVERGITDQRRRRRYRVEVAAASVESLRRDLDRLGSMVEKGEIQQSSAGDSATLILDVAAPVSP